MKWLDPLPTDCPACGGRFPVPVDELRALRAVCPGCGASLAAVGQRMLDVEAPIRRQVDLLLVAIDLEEHAGVAVTDDEVDAARTLEDLARTVADRLPAAADREARASGLVTEAARRVAPRLLAESESSPGAGGL